MSEEAGQRRHSYGITKELVHGSGQWQLPDDRGRMTLVLDEAARRGLARSPSLSALRGRRNESGLPSSQLVTVGVSCQTGRVSKVWHHRLDQAALLRPRTLR